MINFGDINSEFLEEAIDAMNSEGIYYALKEGYIKPFMLLNDKTLAAKISNAVKIIEELEEYLLTELDRRMYSE